MDNSWKQMMESNVSDYIKQVDFKNPEFSLNEFKAELAKILGVTPAVKLKWNTIEKVNELLKASGAKGHTQKIDQVEQIDIFIVDSDNKLPINFKFII